MKNFLMLDNISNLGQYVCQTLPPFQLPRMFQSLKTNTENEIVPVSIITGRFS